jgi:hypothetical protein
MVTSQFCRVATSPHLWRRPQDHRSTLSSIKITGNWRGSFLSFFPTYNSSSVYNILHLASLLLQDVVYSPREWGRCLVLICHANRECFGRFLSSIGAEKLLLVVEEASGLGSRFRLPLGCTSGCSSTPLDVSSGSDHHTRRDGAVCQFTAQVKTSPLSSK